MDTFLIAPFSRDTTEAVGVGVAVVGVLDIFFVDN
jgi:hypothetical protein